jgi:hypothetical protein
MSLALQILGVNKAPLSFDFQLAVLGYRCLRPVKSLDQIANPEERCFFAPLSTVLNVAYQGFSSIQAAGFDCFDSRPTTHFF